MAGKDNCLWWRSGERVLKCEMSRFVSAGTHHLMQPQCDAPHRETSADRCSTAIPLVRFAQMNSFETSIDCHAAVNFNWNSRTPTHSRILSHTHIHTWDHHRIDFTPELGPSTKPGFNLRLIDAAVHLNWFRCKCVPLFRWRTARRAVSGERLLRASTKLKTFSEMLNLTTIPNVIHYNYLIYF